MLDHVAEHDKAQRLRTAISDTLNKDQVRTGDLGGKAGTEAFTKAVIARL
jgi:isocitrate dehydrogenase (NAD+)